jgi:hypothetical protein
MHNYPLAVGVHDERDGQDWWAKALDAGMSGLTCQQIVFLCLA